MHVSQELEADFRGVREEVDLKRRELDRVSAAITEIESTRERKTVEFRRMQANLMELLREQKLELDAVKEKGVQLEVTMCIFIYCFCCSLGLRSRTDVRNGGFSVSTLNEH